jgi:hypothetical protein
LSYSCLVDIRIGIANSPREISFESAQSPDEVEALVTAGMESGTIRLLDNKGKVYIVQSASLAYIEIGTEAGRRVGFVA